MIYSWLADLVLVVHSGFVAFVVLMLGLIFIGGARGWHWVRGFWLRIIHLAAITLVVVQSWFGIVCPLTTLESWLRRQAGETSYTGSFIEHWLHQLLYWQAPAWVFIAVYTVFGLIVLSTWFIVPPRRRITKT